MITIVSGFIRSGTSMMMRMLHVGGLPVVFDAERRPADVQNPNGYYESPEFMELSPEGLACVGLLDGKAVKIIAAGLPHWPAHMPAKVIFMERDVWERAQSMAIMQRADLARGRYEPPLEPHNGPALVDSYLPFWRERIFAMPQLDLLSVSYNTIGDDPHAAAVRVRDHLGVTLDVDAMAAVWDSRLYRNRAMELHAAISQ